MNVNLITVPKEIEKQEYLAYKEALKKGKKEDYLEEMKQLNYYLAKGKKVIDVFAAFENTGLNNLQQPRLAVCSAVAKDCFFEKMRSGSGAFRAYNQRWGLPKSQTNLSVIIPENIYNTWDLDEETQTIKDPLLSTRVPIVPVKLLPKGGLQNYHIIWEVDQWQVRRAPVDPILAKRITRNLFVVLAIWDLTELEKALVEGR